MEGGARACLIAIALALAALQSCGAGNDGAGGEATAAKAGHGVALKQIGRFEDPVYVDSAPGYPDLLFVVEQPGRVEVLRKGQTLPHPFLDISSRVDFGGERGLLSIAFAPDYRQSRRFYVYYTDRQGNIRVDEFKRRTATRAAAGSRRSVIEIPHPGFANHNGGQLQFLGNLLYFGTGDGGSGGDPPNNAQNKNVLLGKLLRIDPRPSAGRPYSIPAGNPFVGPDAGARRDLQLRAAQPVPLLLRHRQRRTAANRDRRRRPEPVRGARLHDGRRGSGRQLRLGRVRGLLGLPRRKQRHPGPRRNRRNRSSPTPTAAAAAARSSAATSSATGDSRSLYGATSTPTSARAGCAALVPHRNRASGDRILGLDGRLAELVRRRRPGADLCRLARRAGLPARSQGSALGWSASFNEGSLSGERHGRDEQASTGTSSRGERRQWQRQRAERIEVLNPATGELVAHDSTSTPPSRSPRPWRACAPTRPTWEALGIEGRYHWLGKLRDWLLDNHDRDARHDAGGDRQGPRRHLHRARLPRRPDQLLRHQGERSSSARKAVRPHSPLLAVEEAAGPVPAAPGGRRHQPLELPAGPGARRRDPGTAGRRRGRRQAVRVHPARPDRGGQGLEGGDRRLPTCSTASTAPARPAAPWSTTSTSSSSPAPTGPAAR